MVSIFTVREREREILTKLLILFIFSCVLYAIRVPYGLISDDAVVAPTISEQTLFENIIYHWKYNGRIITDVFANLFYRMPIIVWKLFDILVYIIIVLLISACFTRNSCADILLVCTMVLLFPADYLNSAGYIATSTNYVYPVACLLGVVYNIYLVRKLKWISWSQYPVNALCILYITNHDQSGVVLIGGLFLYVVFCILTKEGRQIVANAVFWLLFSVICYLFMFLVPGHIYRMTDTAEMEYWFPQYATWSFAKKIYHGFSSTVANFLFSKVKLFSLFSLLLFVSALSRKKLVHILIAAIPLTVMGGFSLVGTDRFVIFYDYSCGMPDLLPLSISVFPLFISIISVCCIFYTVCACIKDRQRKLSILMLLVLAAGSREMMGLSATIYASSFRTFTFSLYAVIVCCLLILQELKAENDRLWYLGLGSISVALIL